MWQYVIRRLLYNIPVYLGILLFVMFALRVNDPIWARLPKHATQEDYDNEEKALGLDDPFVDQYVRLLTKFDMDRESWDKPGRTVGTELKQAVWPSLAITLPALLLTSLVSVTIGLFSPWFTDRITPSVEGWLQHLQHLR